MNPSLNRFFAKLSQTSAGIPAPTKIGFQLLLALVLAGSLVAQTTGKIMGHVSDSESNEPLAGANILIEGTTRGAAADVNGDFYIINVPPGSYTLRVQMIGYEAVRITNLRVSVNRTTTVEARLKQAVVAGEEIEVVAEKFEIKKDQTSSIRNVSSEDIDILPVETVGAVINMQPGIVVGHFRGGRSDEVSYLIDGLQVDETFGGNGRTVDLEPEAIQDLEVITGTFNAEYGRAMSGVVNAVTKTGGKKFHGSVSANFANFYTVNKDIFIGLKDSEFDRNKDYKFQLSGPVLSDRLTFLANLRYQDNKNHLNGIRRFNVDDLSNFQAEDPSLWFSEHTGDSAIVSMNRSKNLSLLGKLTAAVSNNMKVSFLYTRNDDEWHGYDHAFKYNPDGRGTSYRESSMYSLSINHLLSTRVFYEVKFSYVDNFNGWYVFENPTDPRYVHDKYLYNDHVGFFTGGQQKDHSRRWLKDTNVKFDLSWQLNKNHSLKTGVHYIHHDLENRWSQIRNRFFGTDSENVAYEPVIYADSTVFSDIYNVKPIEFSGYAQDKIEFEDMVLNVGVRYDYFDPATTYPSQRRNPANQLQFTHPDSVSRLLDADPKHQISPRLGLAYQLSDVALLHFSYGHFFQMPPMYAMYQNHALRVAPNDYETTMGNPQIKAQKTVQYEIGLWQQLAEGMGLEVALFYRDIYDLLSAKVISTFNQIEYGLYSNKDYGNAKGLELKYEFRTGPVSAYLNYTLQYTRGNADNPTFTFSREGSSRDPVPTLIPMSWDQRHTLNATVGYNTARYGVTATGYYDSGTPFTWEPLQENLLSRVNLYPNNAWKPSQVRVDLSAYYNMQITGRFQLRFTLLAQNLLDRLNEVWVNSQTGRAYTAIITESDLAAHRATFTSYQDRVRDPSSYAAPRSVKFGIGLTF